MTDDPDFIRRYHEMVDELDREGRSDTETMWLLGSLVARLVSESEAKNWMHLKQVIDDAGLEALVVSLDSNAETYAADGKPKAAYVARLLGVSLVASRMADQKLRARDRLLDNFLDTAGHVYIQSHTGSAG